MSRERCQDAHRQKRRARLSPVYTSDPAASEWDTFPTEEADRLRQYRRQAGVGVARRDQPCWFSGRRRPVDRKGGGGFAGYLNADTRALAKFCARKAPETARRVGASGDLRAAMNYRPRATFKGQVEGHGAIPETREPGGGRCGNGQRVPSSNDGNASLGKVVTQTPSSCASIITEDAILTKIHM